jgi:signal transduction histidine kinase
MNLITKLVGSSSILAGLIVVITVGSDFLVSQVETSAKLTEQQMYHAHEKVVTAKVDLRNQIAAIKNYLVVGYNSQDLRQYQKAMSNFLLTLDEIEALTINSSEISNVRQQHRLFVNLANKMRETAASSEQRKQDYTTINTYRTNIDLALNILLESVDQKRILATQKVNEVKEVTRITKISTTILILLIFYGQLILILLPVVRSIKELQIGAEKVGSGQLNYRLNISTKDEIEQLAHAFNQMSERLSDLYFSLETRVLERTQELTQINQQLEQEIIERQQIAYELQETLENLQKTQTKLIQTEKMSSLGQMVAGVAHEINNPINFIYGNITHAGEYMQEMMTLIQLYQKYYTQPAREISEYQDSIEFEFLQEDLLKVLNSMKIGAERIREIIVSLRNFSRLDEAEMKEVNLHEGIESTLLILQHRLHIKPEYPEIKVTKNYGDLPLVECYAGQLNQVFMNLITNAIDAIESQGKNHPSTENQSNQLGCITIQTQRLNADWVQIKISDTGLGISPEVMKRLFDPFFTTKEVGKGTGLGLSISYQIVVEKHQGFLKCFSELGEGTEFIIEIPIRQNALNSQKLTSASPPNVAAISHEEIAFNTSKPAP